MKRVERVLVALILAGALVMAIADRVRAIDDAHQARAARQAACAQAVRREYTPSVLVRYLLPADSCIARDYLIGANP